ncbi:hypothetical protein [Streptacidiphilus sp. EB103A]|uniref:hypothetical protein n=1 Tax=Streptacidiphilus sp. EB103A TaxID=3156275 RepID=UPI00351750A6
MFESHQTIAVADLARVQARDLYITTIATLLGTACRSLRRRNPPKDAHFCGLLGYDGPDSSALVKIRDDFLVSITVTGMPSDVVRKMCSSGDIYFTNAFNSLGRPSKVGSFQISAKGKPQQRLRVHPNETADAVLIMDISSAASALCGLGGHLSKADAVQPV